MKIFFKKFISAFSRLKILFKECIDGSTLYRVLQNLCLAKITISNSVIDLGSKDTSSSYYRFFNLKNITKITHIDLYKKSPKTILLDLEKPFNLNEKYDTALLLNVLQHLENPIDCLNEIYKILKEGGRLVGAMTFSHSYHPSPFDYCRYSHIAIEHYLKKIKYRNIKVYKIGSGIFCSGLHHLVRAVKFKPLVFILWIIVFSLDNIFDYIYPSHRINYYIGTVFTAEK